MNFSHLKPMFDESQIRAILNDTSTIQAGARGLRLNVATSIMNGMLQGPLLGAARQEAQALIIGAQNEQTRVRAVTNGQMAPAELDKDTFQAIQNTAIVILVRDAYQIADQLIAANHYIAPGERLVVPMIPIGESNDADASESQ